jgi:nucleotide-binding universal stress UspA family protein
MMQKKILVFVESSGKALNSVYYALALAKRLKAQVYILRHDMVEIAPNSMSIWLEEALSDLINSARQAGLTVSDHISHSKLKKEIVGLIRDENIDVLVFGADNSVCKQLMLQIKDLFPGQIIQVKEKDYISYL